MQCDMGMDPDPTAGPGDEAIHHSMKSPKTDVRDTPIPEEPLAPPLPTLETLRSAACSYIAEDACATIVDAYNFAAAAHEGMRRKSGEPYVVHPLTTAIILAQMRMDPTTIVAGLLHDVVEDTDTPLSEVEARFGTTVAHLVDGVTKIGNFSRQQIDLVEQRQNEGDGKRKGDGQQRRQAENIKKMFMAMAEDPRVIVVKLADRLHNMRTLDALEPHKQQRKALETREIYAPLAGRLGMAQVKWELEDQAFKYLESEAYWWLVGQIAEQRPRREQYVKKAGEILLAELQAQGMAADVTGRAKHLYSIYRKLLRPEINMDLQRVYDLYALRVLVGTVPECYQALGYAHAVWTPLPGRFKDYIAAPKPNGYQSLHTTVLGPDGRQLEVQIRTHEMHRLAEYGVAAHLFYKEEGSTKPAPASLTNWIQTLMSWQEETQTDSADFIDTLKIDVFQDQVFVFSPKGDVIDLPARSTPIDFAYRIHTDIGNRCIGAKVNGMMVQLDHQLHTGDRVEILTTKTAHGPSRDWLNFVASAGARAKIRSWFKHQNRDENIARGRAMLEHELQRLEQRTLSSLTQEQLSAVATSLQFSTPDDLYAAIGYGAIGPQQVVGRLKLRDEAPPELELPVELRPPDTISTGQVRVMGVGDLLTRLAACCHPAPGDEIVGYITRNRGVTVHRASCPRVLTEQEKERLVQVDWGPAVQQSSYPVAIVIHAWDREGLLRDVSAAISEERLNITASSTITVDHNATIRITLHVSSVEQLSRLFSRIERVRGVIDVSRDGSARKAHTA